MNEGLFDFESDYNDGLRCVPMAVRLKLDATGVKLDLRAWAAFEEEERRELLDLPAGPAFRARARALSQARAGIIPPDLAVPTRFLWEEASPPPDLSAKASAEGVPLDKWPSLSPLQRFALIKLARPSHENRDFLPACREFGLVP